jgi:thymidine phosphorylase
LSSGRALEVFRKNIELQGGDPRVCDEPKLLLNEKLLKIQIFAGSSGYVAEIDTLAVGNAVCEIGGGRTKAEDGVDYAVGYASEIKIGDRIDAGEPLGLVYCRDAGHAEQVSEKLLAAYSITDESPERPDLIRTIIS